MSKVVNYAVRILIVLTGIVFASGVLDVTGDEATRYRIMGIVFILFGIYRIVLYRLKSQQLELKMQREAEDSNEVDKPEDNN